MGWRHYEVRSAGAITLFGAGIPVRATYEMGIVSTGRTRVFNGHFVRVVLPDGQKATGEDEHSLRAALRKLRDALSALRIEFCCVGLDPRWVESGLSVDTGWGYWERQAQAIHIMAPIPPAPFTDTALDLEIHEAVARMRIGLPR